MVAIQQDRDTNEEESILPGCCENYDKNSLGEGWRPLSGAINVGATMIFFQDLNLSEGKMQIMPIESGQPQSKVDTI
jgi:hypothetical protein